MIRGTMLPSVHLRFCPDCTERERNIHGEAYWHRVHQVPGVCVCPEHATLLEESNIPMRYLYGSTIFHAAEPSIPVTQARRLKGEDEDDKTLIRIATEASWLLKSSLPGNDLGEIRRHYLAHALCLGYASQAGAVHWKKLIPAFRSRYSERLLETMQCGLPPEAPKKRDHWIAEILHQPRKPQAPVRYLLLMDFLGVQASEFFQFKSVLHSPFGKGPWGCINPVCPSAGRLGIELIAYEFASTEIVGVLTCPQCGQVSCRKTIDGKERRWVRKPGPIWEVELERVCNNNPPSLYAISKRLGASASTIKYQAARLGLKLPGVIPSIPPGSDANSRIGRRALRIQKNCAERKAQWLALRAEFPLKSTNELLIAAPACYSYLYRYEREWLKANSPASQRRPPPARKAKSVESLDMEISLKVAAIKQELLETAGKPQRVSKSRLINRLSALYQKPVKLHKMPLTAEEIATLAERVEDFRIRKRGRIEEFARTEIQNAA